MRKILFLTTIILLTFSVKANVIAPNGGFADIVEPLMPAVVNVYTVQYNKNIKSQRNEANPFDGIDPFQKFFDNFNFPFGFEELYTNPKASALGSGFIIDSAGYVVTNHHVIAGADEINVKLNDNTELPAKLIGSDPRTDLALLKVESKNPLPYVKFGDSNKSRVGDLVIAIGNPFGLGGTVTTGIISSKSRDINADAMGIVDDFIQTDAAINVGNSGGPMFNVNGEVIGVNTAILSSSGGTNIGIGFSIPSSTANNVISQLKAHGKVSRGMLNIKIQEITPDIAEAINLPAVEGVLVAEVEPSGAGAKAGLKSGDIITQINDVKIKNSRKLQITIAEAPVNSKIKISILRNGEQKNIECLITEVTKDHHASAPNQNLPNVTHSGDFETHGVVFSNFKEIESGGVVVSKIKPGSSWRGIAIGDNVLSLNQHPVASVKDFELAYNKAIGAGKKHVMLFIKRQNSKLFLALPI